MSAAGVRIGAKLLAVDNQSVVGVRFGRVVRFIKSLGQCEMGL